MKLHGFGQLLDLLNQGRPMFTRTAVGDLSTLDSMATPCSVKTRGRLRPPPCPKLEIAFLRLQDTNFLQRKLIGKVERKAILISRDLFIEPPGGNSVKIC